MEKRATSLLLPFVLVQACVCGVSTVGAQENLSCEYQQMTDFLHQLTEKYSNVSRLVSIGKTDEGRELWTMIISDTPHHRPVLKPQVKFVGNVNGVSGPACYVLLRLIQEFLKQSGNEASMERQLMESMEIHVLPNMNPDGYSRTIPGSCLSKNGRLNANSVNLNTNFPDIFSDEQPSNPLEKETQAVMGWIQQNVFTISISVISGAEVVVFPFDSIIVTEYDKNEPHLTPDNDIFHHLATLYGKHTGTPEAGWFCPALRRTFPNGMINGAEWQPQSGTMMDYNYISGVFEIMVGISCCRNENNQTFLEEMWWRNREGLLHVINAVDTGIRGQVLDSETYLPIPGAKLTKESNDVFSMPWYTSSQGEFWRPWRPDTYVLLIEKEGYHKKEIEVEVRPRQPSFLRVELHKVVPVTKPPPPTSPSTTTATSTSTEKPRKQTTPSSISNMTLYWQSTMSTQEHVVVTQNKIDTIEVSNENVKPFQHYSSLTQLDHSFINLIRGIQFRNSATQIHPTLILICVSFILGGLVLSI